MLNQVSISFLVIHFSQVLSKTKIHFSAENIIKISHFLELNSAEEEFLIALLHLERSSPKELKDYWLGKIKVIRNQQLRVEKQVEKNITRFERIGSGNLL